MDKRIPMNTLLASQSYINKLVIFFAHQSNLFIETEFTVPRNGQDNYGSRSFSLDREIQIMKHAMFSYADKGVLQDCFSYWTVETLQIINEQLIEVFIYLKILGTLKSARAYVTYFSSL